MTALSQKIDETMTAKPSEAPSIKSNHALILNRLAEMQRVAYYATARDELALAESTIVKLERELAAAQAEIAALRDHENAIEHTLALVKADRERVYQRAESAEAKLALAAEDSAGLEELVRDAEARAQRAAVDIRERLDTLRIASLVLTDGRTVRQAYYDAIRALPVNESATPASVPSVSGISFNKLDKTHGVADPDDDV
jgi:chromosome segregation ATPase